MHGQTLFTCHTTKSMQIQPSTLLCTYLSSYLNCFAQPECCFKGNIITTSYSICQPAHGNFLIFTVLTEAPHVEADSRQIVWFGRTLLPSARGPAQLQHFHHLSSFNFQLRCLDKKKTNKNDQPENNNQHVCTRVKRTLSPYGKSKGSLKTFQVCEDLFKSTLNSRFPAPKIRITSTAS